MADSAAAVVAGGEANVVGLDLVAGADSGVATVVPQVLVGVAAPSLHFDGQVSLRFGTYGEVGVPLTDQDMTHLEIIIRILNEYRNEFNKTVK